MVAPVESSRALLHLPYASAPGANRWGLATAASLPWGEVAPSHEAAELLARWDAPPHVRRAGLHRAVYDSHLDRGAPIAARDRAHVRAQLGEATEALVYLLAVSTPESLLANAGRERGFSVRCSRSGARWPLSAETVTDLLLVYAASWAVASARGCPEAGRRTNELRRALPHLPPVARAALRQVLAHALDGAADNEVVSLAELLAFDAPAQHAPLLEQCCIALDQRYLELVCSLLACHLGPDHRRRLEALGDEAYSAIVRAPATWACLVAPTGPRDQLEGLIEGALQLEEWRAGARPAVTTAAWSADGELYLPPGTQEGPQQLLYELAHTPREFSPERPYLAPRLGGWLIADLDGPAAARPLAHAPPSTTLAPQARPAALAKLEDALSEVGWVSPCAARFLRHSLLCVVPVASAGEPRGGGAAGVHRAELFDLHHPQLDVARVVCALLREAVHSHLYKRELFCPTLLDEAAGASARVRSPWSGRPIDLYAFAHASAVCHATYGFFARADGGAIPAATASGLCHRAARGFASRQWQAVVDTHHELFAPTMLRDLYSMRSRVLADAAAAELRRRVAS